MRSFIPNIIAVILVLIGVFAYVKHPPWSEQEFPNPMVDGGAKLCGRPKNITRSRICDPEKFLTTAGQNNVDTIIYLIQQGEPPYRTIDVGEGKKEGFQVAIAVVGRIDKSLGSTPEVRVRRFTKYLHDTWGVGDPVYQTGVMAVVAVEERYMYISTGIGAKKYLKDYEIDYIVESVKPDLRAENYDAALQTLAHMIGLGLSKDLRKEIGGLSGEGDLFGVLIILALFILVPILLSMWQSYQRKRRRRQFLDARAQLERLQRDQAAAEQRQYLTTSCPVCMEDFPAQAIQEIAALLHPATPRGASPTHDPSAPGPSAPPFPPDSPKMADELLSSSPSITFRRNANNSSSNHVNGFDEATRFPSVVVTGGDDGREPLLGGANGSFQEPEVGITSSASIRAAAAAVAHAASPVTSRTRGGLDMSKPMEERGAEYGPVYLPCGHALCARCLARWMDSQPGTDNPTCPVCRTPIAPPGGPQRPGGPPSPPPPPRRRWGYDRDQWRTRRWNPDLFSPFPHHHHCGGQGMDIFVPEMMFRLRQLQRRFPVAIDPNAQQRWAEAAAQGRSVNMAADVQQALANFDAVEQVRLQQAQQGRQGQGGESRGSWSFGGGNSSGGGGRGGSW